jgi:hypothetical protein
VLRWFTLLLCRHVIQTSCILRLCFHVATIQEAPLCPHHHRHFLCAIQLLAVNINQSVFTSRVLGLICASEARTAIGSDGQPTGTSQELQALNAL